MRQSLRFFASSTLVTLSLVVSRAAYAQDPAAEPLPPLPPSQTPASGHAVTSETPVVNAGVVRTNRVDTVVVAEPGSNVTVHARSTKHEYEPDPARKAAIIASPIVLGVGGLAAGVAYLSARASQNCTYTTYNNTTTQSYTNNCTHGNTVPPLVLYDTIVGAVPSAPRWVVGDVSGALLYTGLRGGSLLIASVVNWGTDDSSWIGPFTLGFLVPITLAVVDLATAPHREDLQPSPKPPGEESRALRPRLTGITPVAITGPERRVDGAALNVSASF
jgi:hypothetical protein